MTGKVSRIRPTGNIEFLVALEAGTRVELQTESYFSKYGKRRKINLKYGREVTAVVKEPFRLR
jgi:molybdopterin-binding protein